MSEPPNNGSRPDRATAGGSQPDAAAAPTTAECPAQAGDNTENPQVYLRKVEIVFHNDNPQERSWPRDMFPFSSDPVTLQAIVWATEDESDQVGQPYAFWPDCDPTNPYEGFTDDGFYRTGDRARIDEEGFLRVEGRKKRGIGARYSMLMEK